jgi:hypothetical protein
MSTACPVFGFDVTLRLAPDAPAPAERSLAPALAAALAERGLSASALPAPADRVWRRTITRDGSQAVDADREALRAWAAARPEIAGVGVGPLVDLGPSAG